MRPVGAGPGEQSLKYGGLWGLDELVAASLDVADNLATECIWAKKLYLRII